MNIPAFLPKLHLFEVASHYNNDLNRDCKETDRYRSPFYILLGTFSSIGSIMLYKEGVEERHFNLLTKIMLYKYLTTIE